MRYITFSNATDTTPRVGVVVTEHGVDHAVDLPRALPQLDIPGDMRRYIAAGSELHTQVGTALARGVPTDAVERLDSVRLHAPLRPGKIVGIGLNYVEHVEESSRTLDTSKDLPDRPVLFSKPATAVIGPEQAIRHNAALTSQLDWECELGVVIGTDAFGVAEADAYQYVFGYTIVNDISARDQRRSGQWFYSKGQDSFAPMGPMIVTTDEIDDPHTLRLTLSVSGEQMQDGNSAQMLFRIPKLIADITSGVTLEAGDVISTGSPQGVGAAKIPPRYLQPGDVVEATIERIGTLRNPVVAV